MKLLLPLSVLLTALAAMHVDATPRVDPGVHRALKRQGTVNLIVTMKNPVTEVLNLLPLESAFSSRGEMILNIVDKLQQHAQAAQAVVTKLLSLESTLFNRSPLASATRSFWITNQIFFKDASYALVQKLAFLPGIASIDEEPFFELEPIWGQKAPKDPTPVGKDWTLEWGVEKIRAGDVWNSGYSGKGVVVGSIDTGVLATHETLAGNFRNEFGWYDAVNKSSVPFDDKGHGTHAMGTAVGSYGIGVAPSAQWIACRACDVSGCTASALLDCMQFMTCPTDPTGKTKDCSKAPHVVNNSWGGGQNDPTFQTAIKAWHAAGIIPIFSGGNKGEKGCSTIEAPGEYANVITVGATDVNDRLGPFSAKGPTVNGVTKPEITAPGVDVVSGWGSGPADYFILNGTSMAAPHVTGAVALMLSANPKLTYNQIRKALLATTDQKTLQPSGFTCGNTPDTVFPNNQYGYGRLNALSLITGMRA